MAVPPSLLAQITAFLATRSTSDGGYAPVGAEDLSQLRQIIRGLLKAKYETDPDGDLPVEAYLVDRTRFEPLHYLPTPYLRDEQDQDIRLLSDRLRTAVTNLSIAQRGVDMAHRAIEYGLAERMEAGLTVSAGATTYGPLLPTMGLDGIREAILTAMATHQQAYPVTPDLFNDYKAKQSWLQSAEQAIKEATGAAVKVRLLQHRTSGAHTLDVEVCSLRRQGQDYGPSVRLPLTAVTA